MRIRLAFLGNLLRCAGFRRGKESPLRKHLVLAVAAAAAMLVVLGPGLAGADTATPPAGSTVDAVHLEEVQGSLKFVAPGTVPQGGHLETVNATKPQKVG